MIRRFRKWLTEHFLPVWAKETILEENQVLHRELDRQKAAYKQLRAYADGLEQGLYAVRGMKINISMEGSRLNEHHESTI